MIHVKFLHSKGSLKLGTSLRRNSEDSQLLSLAELEPTSRQSQSSKHVCYCLLTEEISQPGGRTQFDLYIAPSLVALTKVYTRDT
jgi:hypothetical protein